MPDLETVIPVWELWFLNGIRMACSSIDSFYELWFLNGIRMACSSIDSFFAQHDSKDYHVVMPHTRYFSTNN